MKSTENFCLTFLSSRERVPSWNSTLLGLKNIWHHFPENLKMVKISNWNCNPTFHYLGNWIQIHQFLCHLNQLCRFLENSVPVWRGDLFLLCQKSTYYFFLLFLHKNWGFGWTLFLKLTSGYIYRVQMCKSCHLDSAVMQILKLASNVYLLFCVRLDQKEGQNTRQFT